MTKGKLITIEGINGIGKSYYFNYLKKILNENVIFNSEINDDIHSGINKCIFEILLSTNSRFFDTGNPKMETLLILAKQANDDERFVIPNLNQGKSIISDRGFDTVVIVQGIMMYKRFGGTVEKHVREIYQIAKKFNLIPDKTILLTGDFNKSLQRATIRDQRPYSKEEIEILKLESKLLKEIAQKEKERFVIINVDQDSEQVKNEIQSVFQKLLK